jgi:hypothetical protein
MARYGPSPYMPMHCLRVRLQFFLIAGSPKIRLHFLLQKNQDLVFRALHFAFAINLRFRISHVHAPRLLIRWTAAVRVPKLSTAPCQPIGYMFCYLGKGVYSTSYIYNICPIVYARNKYIYAISQPSYPQVIHKVIHNSNKLSTELSTDIFSYPQHIFISWYQVT